MKYIFTKLKYLWANCPGRIYRGELSVGELSVGRIVLSPYIYALHAIMKNIIIL